MEALSPELALVDDELAAAARAALAPAPDVFAALELLRANRDVVRRLRDSFIAQEAAVAEQASVRSRAGARRRLAGVAFASSVAVGAIVTGALALGREDVPEPQALASNAPATPARPAVRPHRSVGAAVARRTEPAAKPAQKPHRAAAAPRSKPTRRVVSTRKPGTVVSTPKPAHKAAAPARKARRVTAATPVRPSAAPVLAWPLARRATYYRVRVYRVTGQFLFEVWSDKTRLAVPATWKNGSTKNRLAPGRYGWAVYPAYGNLGEPSSDPSAAEPLAGGHFSV